MLAIEYKGFLVAGLVKKNMYVVTMRLRLGPIYETNRGYSSWGFVI